MIQNPAKLTLSRGQLRLENDGGTHTLPLEDVTVLILESPQISLTSALMARCAEDGVVILSCDETHMPNGLLAPFQPHSRQSRVARIQMSCTEALKNRLWQRVIQAKIAGQAECLRREKGDDAARRILSLVDRVSSGDPDNVEAQAARDYWSRLFGRDFRRGAGDPINAALNYGYAVLRAHVARSQVSYGLIPAFGIHHESELNAFNLTDDMLETVRPFVDHEVVRLRKDGAIPEFGTLPLQVRQALAGIGSTRCRMGDQIHTLSNVAEKLASGLVSAIEGKSAALLDLPEFCKGAQSSVHPDSGDDE